MKWQTAFALVAFASDAFGQTARIWVTVRWHNGKALKSGQTSSWSFGLGQSAVRQVWDIGAMWSPVGGHPCEGLHWNSFLEINCTPSL